MNSGPADRINGRRVRDMVGKDPTPVSYYMIRWEGLSIGALLAQGERNTRFLAVMGATDLETRLSSSEAWGSRLSKDDEEGFGPIDSIRRWKGVPSQPGVGGIPQDARLHTCADLDELSRLLNPGHEPEKDTVNERLQDTHMLYGRDWGPFVTKRVDTGYRVLARGEVLYRPVRMEGTIIGFLWASDAENARGYEPRPAAGPAAWRAESWWIDQAAEVAARGLTPVGALRERIGMPEDPVGGRLDSSDDELIIASTRDLRQIARPT